jgi:hypothetical protein
MPPTGIRQKLHRQIDQLPSALLTLVDEFLEFLKFRRGRISESASLPEEPEAGADAPVLTGSKGADLIQFAGTWQGDDFEDCLQAVYDNRSLTEF